MGGSRCSVQAISLPQHPTLSALWFQGHGPRLTQNDTKARSQSLTVTAVVGGWR